VPEKKAEAWVTFRAEAALIKKLEAEAKEQDRPRSWVIRQLLVKALESQREKATA
jgi:predicted transcriptional regulator